MLARLRLACGCVVDERGIVKVPCGTPRRPHKEGNQRARAAKPGGGGIWLHEKRTPNKET